LLKDFKKGEINEILIPGTPEKVHYRWLRTSIVIPATPASMEKKYFITMDFPSSDNVEIKLQVSQEEWEQLTVGHIISVRIEVKIKYLCLHLKSKPEKPISLMKG